MYMHIYTYIYAYIHLQRDVRGWAENPGKEK